MLIYSFALAMSELPIEKIQQCWEPLSICFTSTQALHAKQKEQLDRLFPRMTHGNGISLIVPEGTEPEPDVAADDEEADDDEAAEDVNAYLSTVVADMEEAANRIAQAYAMHG